MKKEKKISNTKHILLPEAQLVRNKIDELLKKTKKYQSFVFHQDSSGVFISDNFNYISTSITNSDEKVHVLEKMNRLMKSPNGVLFVKSHKILSGVTYTKKGRASSSLTIWGKHNVSSIIHTDVFKHLVKTVNPDSQKLFDDGIIQEIATKGLIGSILRGKVSTIDEAMKYRISYFLKRSCGIEREDSSGLYYLYKGCHNRFSAEKLLNISLKPRVIVNLFNPLSANTNMAFNILEAWNTNSFELSQNTLIMSEKIDWIKYFWDRKSFKVFMDTNARKVNAIKSIIDIWSKGPNFSLKRNVGNFNILPF